MIDNVIKTRNKIIQTAAACAKMHVCMPPVGIGLHYSTVIIVILQVCQKLGWTPPSPPGRFDPMPLVLQANGGNPEIFEIPKDLVLEVEITHPE